MIGRVLIVGAGLAGARCAETLRARGFDGQVRVVGDEPFPPYERPALSKELLLGNVDLSALRLREPRWWRDQDIEFLLGRRVEAIDVRGRRALLRGGEELAWDALVVATGARPRGVAAIPTARGVHRLRSLQDALALRRELLARRRLLIVGAGFIGTEVASSAARLGVDVTLVDPTPPLRRVLGAEVSGILAARYREHGVDVRTTGIDELDMREGCVRAATLQDGTTVACDAVLVAVGADPSGVCGLGRAGSGVPTDAEGRTAVPRVFACGDTASAWHPALGRHVRVEHWTEAAGQGAAVAHSIVGVDPAPRQLPMFWSDQFGLRLQFVGHAPSFERVELEGAENGFTARYLDARGRVIAALAANRPRVLGELRRELLEALPRAA